MGAALWKEAAASAEAWDDSDLAVQQGQQESQCHQSKAEGSVEGTLAFALS